MDTLKESILKHRFFKKHTALTRRRFANANSGGAKGASFRCASLASEELKLWTPLKKAFSNPNSRKK